MDTIIKYPRTRHVDGSNIQAGDEDLKKVLFEEIRDTFVVLEEKVDGANCGISFDGNGKILLQSRGHYLNGGYGERQFDLFKQWAGCFAERLYDLLGTRYVLYGEWLYAKHTVFYDRLSHYFMEFDIYDKSEQVFFSTAKRKQMLQNAPFITSVLVLYEGKLKKMEELKSWITASHFKSPNANRKLMQYCESHGLDYGMVASQTDPSDQMEGIYIKVENADIVTDRLKYVRRSFTNTILDSQTHWVNRPIIPNQLMEQVNLFTEEVLK